MEKAVEELKRNGELREDLMPYIWPLGWEHINFFGEYKFEGLHSTNLDSLRPLHIKEPIYSQRGKMRLFSYMNLLSVVFFRNAGGTPYIITLTRGFAISHTFFNQMDLKNVIIRNTKHLHFLFKRAPGFNSN
ncbi:hypothetical protein FORC087_596 (plasmid) [Bacillus cereus]|nr:hypothetical protein FORC087_596 [Bacillus cereus]